MDKRELIVEYGKSQYPIRKIAQLLGISKNTVKKYLRNERKEHNTVNEVPLASSEEIEKSRLEEIYAKDIRLDQQLQLLEVSSYEHINFC